LDTDDSGIISPDEMALFLKNRIGGSQFDNSDTVNKEVGQVMKQLDLNHDNGLEMADVEGYWRRLESLLTAEEVSDWVVHAIQLPAEIGRIFLQNGITGYDFPEIVQGGGSVLQDELGLKSSFRSKIVRGVQARMLGIGSTPEQVVAEFKLASCRSVSLKWSKSQARIFPVHSYRVQRRAISLFEANDRGEIESLSMSLDSNGQILPPATAWKTIYVGGETEYVDSTLEMGHNYMYRIQAWNSVGRSGWEVIDLERALRKKGCSTKSNKKRNSDPSVTTAMRGIPQIEDDESWEWLYFPQKLAWGIFYAVNFVYHSARVFFMVIAIGGAIMRIRRASASSSASATATLPFPWFWEGINKLSVTLTRHECIPRTMLGDKEALLAQEKLHDDRMMATGLRGYNRINLKKEEYNNSNGAKENGKNEVTFVNGTITNADRRGSMAKAKSNSTGNLSPILEPTALPNDVIVKAATPNKFGWKRNSKTSLYKSSDSSSVLSSETESNKVSSERSNYQSPQPLIDDGSVCIVCQKRFKFGKRYKHHCSRCMATFCHKHGKTTHNNFTSCKVPGSCLCNPCLEGKSGYSTRSSSLYL
jgi:hypothetical protein